MMRLLCPEILHSLRHKPILIALAPGGEPIVAESSDRRRQKLLGALLPKIHGARKFIFDSGSDSDAETVSAIRDTSVAMIEANLFHQPHPVCWIEDVYEDDPDNQRNFYLTIEEPKKITIWFFQKLNVGRFFGNLPGMKHFPDIAFHPYPLIIQLDDPKDTFQVMDVQTSSLTEVYGKLLGEAVYAFKKLLVTLNTENLLVEKVRASAAKNWKGDPRNKPYDHSIIRIPLDEPSAGEGRAEGRGMIGGRRKHLVRGYIWARNTRPKEEQRWVKPYWRGQSELGTIERGHYEIG